MVRVTWREAVQQVCKAAHISQAALARKADLYPMALTRYLRKANTQRTYSPDAKRVRDINHAAAALASVPRSGVSEHAGRLGRAAGAAAYDEAEGGFLLELVAEFDPYFEGGAERAILEAVAPLGRSARLDIARRCALARGRELVHWLAGKPPKSAGLAEFLSFFREAGAPLDGSLRRNEALVRRLVRDRFDVRVCEEIARIDGESPAAPLKAAREILNAFEKALDDALDHNINTTIARGRLAPHSSRNASSIAQVRRRRRPRKDKNNK